MVWGAFSEAVYSKFSFLSGKQTAQMYAETLKEYLLPFCEEPTPGNWILQRDNASIHTATLTKSFLKSNSVNVLPWPARSPDLNPTENIWEVLSRRVYRKSRQFCGVKELKDCITMQWARMDRDLRCNLVKSMTKRCMQVLKRAGRKTEFYFCYVACNSQ